MTSSEESGLAQRRGRVGSATIAGLAVIGMALGGCVHADGGMTTGSIIADPAARHPILVGKRPIELRLAVGSDSYGLARDQRSELRTFIRRFKKHGSGRLLVAAPSGTPNEVAAMTALGDVRAVLRRARIPGKAVDFRPYYAEDDPQAPLKVSYLRYAAEASDCGDWSDNIAEDASNLPFKNFGCTTQRNLAAMISDPRDLVRPRGTTPRPGERRDTVWDKYKKGETTGATKGKDESGAVSDVAKQ